MHGMMLPSGNDAAQSLATYFGNLVQLVEKRSVNPKQTDANLNLQDYIEEVELNKSEQSAEVHSSVHEEEKQEEDDLNESSLSK